MDYPNYNDNVPRMPDSSDEVWKSDPSFSYSILSGVYKVANNNLHSTFPSYEDMKVCGINEEDLLDLTYCDDGATADEIMRDHRGPMVYMGVWLCLAVIFTFVGIVWCIVNKCCCCCGGKKNQLDLLVNTDEDIGVVGLENPGENNEINPVWKIVVGVLMGLWIIGFSFSVFVSFASNEGLRSSIFELYDKVSGSIDDTEEYLNITKQQINATFVTSFDDLAVAIREKSAGDQSTNAYSTSVRNMLSTTKTLLIEIDSLENRGGGQSTELGEMSQSLRALQTLVSGTVASFSQTMSQNGDIEEKIRITGELLTKNSNDLIGALDEIPVGEVREKLDKAENEYLDTVGSAVYGSFMGFNLILLLTFIGIVVGSAFVGVGVGSGQESAKKTGFIFYRCSIVLMFTTGWFVFLVMITQFSTSGFFSTIVCTAVGDLENDQSGINMTRQIGHFAEYEVPTYAHVASSCKVDNSAYHSFLLQQVYDVNSVFNISDNFKSNSQTMKLASGTNEFYVKNVNSIYYSLNKELRTLQSYKDVAIKTSGSPGSNSVSALYSKTEFALTTLLQQTKDLESRDLSTLLRQTSQQNEEVIDQVDHYEKFVFNQVSYNIGKCANLYRALNSTVQNFCYKLLVPVSTSWWALQFILFMFVAVIITALISERVFK